MHSELTTAILGCIIVGIPFGKILHKTGINLGWLLLLLLPVAGFYFLLLKVSKSAWPKQLAQ
jgi:hypothetical protein